MRRQRALRTQGRTRSDVFVGTGKKNPRASEEGRGKCRSRLHRRVQTGLSWESKLRNLTTINRKKMNSSRGKGICGVVAIKIFAARGDGKRKEDRARGCACRSKGRLGRRAGQFGCRLVGQFGCRSVGQVVCRFAVAEGNRRRLPGRCTRTTGRGGSAKESLWGKVATGALPETK